MMPETIKSEFLMYKMIYYYYYYRTYSVTCIVHTERVPMYEMTTIIQPYIQPIYMDSDKYQCLCFDMINNTIINLQYCKKLFKMILRFH